MAGNGTVNERSQTVHTPVTGIVPIHLTTRKFRFRINIFCHIYLGQGSLGAGDCGYLGGSNGPLLIIIQDSVKLLHQIGELCGVFFLNDGVSEVLPCLPGVSGQINLPVQTPAAVSQSPSV
jgi:hypothetical protein